MSPAPPWRAVFRSLALGLLLSAGVAAWGQGSPAPAPRSERLLPLEVFVNGAKSGVWTLLDRNGLLYAPADAFEEWRLIRSGSGQSVFFQGQDWHPLSAIPGFEARLNFANQSIDLVFSPAAFNSVRLTREAALRPPLSPALPAGFVNYDFTFTNSRSADGRTSRDLGALTEVGASGAWGLLTGSYVGRNLVSHDPANDPSWRRLETTYTRNFLDSNTTLRLGDSVTRPSISGRSLYFGGIQFGRNFALQPGFISQPIPVVSGVSSAPSTLELYINDALRQTSRVPSGPFAIDNLPALTGAGEARVVVTDILGRQTVITQSLFTHGSLLEEGLSDWSFELGAPRRGLGTTNADYGPAFGSGLWRQGLSKTITLEGNVEASARLRRTGLGASYGLPFLMLGQTAFSVSDDQDAGRGWNWLTSVERSGLQHGLSFSVGGSSADHRQLGNGVSPKLQATASYSYSTEEAGAYNLSVGHFATHELGTLRTVSASYTTRVGKRSSFSLAATRLSGTTTGTSVQASLLLLLDDGVVISSGVGRRSGSSEGFVNASRPLGADTGWAWRTAAGSRIGGDFAEAGAYYQGSKGLFSADVGQAAGQQSVRLGVLGGGVFADGRLFATRRVQESFAVIEVPGYADVGVGFQNSVLTRTDTDGVALVPRLLPFQRNSVRLDPSELPISAELDSIEQEVVPALRSAVKITFPVRTGRSALVRITLDDGEPAPAGAGLELVGDPKEFFVARRGEAFITGLKPENQIRLTWKKSTCTIRLVLPPGVKEDIARVGPLRCTGVSR